MKNLLAHAAELWRIRHSTGAAVTLALEPESLCRLETISETVRFFDEYLFGERGVPAFSAMTGLGEEVAEEALRTHLGVCYDARHAAVEFENPAAAGVAALQRAGIAISKVPVKFGTQSAKD